MSELEEYRQFEGWKASRSTACGAVAATSSFHAALREHGVSDSAISVLRANEIETTVRGSSRRDRS
jgi:hypothetical protein